MSTIASLQGLRGTVVFLGIVRLRLAEDASTDSNPCSIPLVNMSQFSMVTDLRDLSRSVTRKDNNTPPKLNVRSRIIVVTASNGAPGSTLVSRAVSGALAWGDDVSNPCRPTSGLSKARWHPDLYRRNGKGCNSASPRLNTERLDRGSILFRGSIVLGVLAWFGGVRSAAMTAAS
ncbi:uncharacterized protein B0H18DRAFT_1101319 [Fomitopsis serialis]|uniref:uncharacterized protein n=1 Tax=Fomitopsis serialis TaxID=139415 RepID=UPI0020077B40|nr:uncharacterized protein B0H18DRAFT_1101319 [Neoantrodia serialis]KAH9935620.1 hypothetical protein B0H18DRAFT_1101319 [Neoantrodia serialis]